MGGEEEEVKPKEWIHSVRSSLGEIGGIEAFPRAWGMGE